MKLTRLGRLTTVLAAVFLMSFVFSACSNMTETSQQITGTDAPTETTPVNQEIPDQVPTVPSGELRLWWSSRKSLNPLLDFSESGQAINMLVFEGLFFIDDRQAILAGIADELIFVNGPGSLTVDIRLAAGFEFHDGQPVTSEDVKACIDFIKAHPGDSPYAAQLSVIDSAVVLDDRSVRLILNRSAPWLRYMLTFPIIPFDSLSSGQFDLIPGTGPFYMKSYSNADDLLLTRYRPSDAVNSLQTIRVLTFDNLLDAMKALAEDRIDLINLSPEEYSRMSLRDSLRFEQYSADDVVFLSYNTKQRRLLSDVDRLIYLKRILTSDAVAATNALPGAYPANVPLSVNSFLLDGRIETGTAWLDGIGEGAWPDSTSRLVVLYPQEDRFRGKLAEIIADMLDQAGIETLLRPLAEDAFRAELLAGQYDIAILKAVIPAQPDPMWLYGENRQTPYSALDSIAGGGLPEFGAWLQRLEASLELTALDARRDHAVLAANLYETAARSPWSVLLVRQAALLYGDRVVGQCMPDRHNPYKGIEELWIWSGQSS